MFYVMVEFTSVLSHGKEAAALFEQNYSLGGLTKSKLECGNI